MRYTVFVVLFVFIFILIRILNAIVDRKMGDAPWQVIRGSGEFALDRTDPPGVKIAARAMESADRTIVMAHGDGTRCVLIWPRLQVRGTAPATFLE